MTLTEKETGLIVQTLSVPLFAFGLETLVSKIGEEEVRALRELLVSIKSYPQLSSVEIKLLATSLLYARDIIDQQEYPTVTGYSWEESTDLMVKMIGSLE